MTTESHRRGFSLVEMLVVVGIIVLVTGMALPALMKARRAARQAQCLENLHELGRMIHDYADQNNDYVPLGTSYGSVDTPDTTPTKRYRSDWNDMIWANPAGIGAKVGLPPVGAMLVNGMITQANAKLCYCPIDVRKRMNVDLFRNRFPAAKGDGGNGIIQISYASRPIEVLFNCSTGLDGDQVLSRLGDLTRKAIMAEPPSRPPYNHGSEGLPAVNVLYDDGAARLVYIHRDWSDMIPTPWSVKPWVEEITIPTKSTQRNDTNLQVWEFLDKQ